MLKNLVIALGIAAITSTSAFAAAKGPKTASATHKVAQTAAAKQDDSKAKKDKKVKIATEAAKPVAAKPVAAKPVAAEPAKK